LKLRSSCSCACETLEGCHVGGSPPSQQEITDGEKNLRKDWYSRVYLPLYHSTYVGELLGLSIDWPVYGCTWKKTSPLAGSETLFMSVLSLSIAVFYQSIGQPTQRALVLLSCYTN